MLNSLSLRHLGLIFLCLSGLFLLANAFFFLKPGWEKFQQLHKQNGELNQQLQKQQVSIAHYQQLLRDMSLLKYPFSVRLESLYQPLSSGELFAQINALAKSQNLQVLELKPQKHQLFAHLQQQIFTLTLAGPELKIFSFLDLLMHCHWLLEIQQLSLTPLHTGAGIQLQALMTAYYV